MRTRRRYERGSDCKVARQPSLCVLRARLLAHQEEGRLFRDGVGRAVKAGLLTKRAVQVMDSSPMLEAAAVQDTYKLIRTALHKLVKGHKRELPAELMPRLKRYLDDASSRWRAYGRRARAARSASILMCTAGRLDLKPS